MVDRGDLFGLLGYDCRWLKLERIRQGFFWGRFWIPVRRAALNDLLNLANFNFNVCNIYRSIKHLFNSCLPQDVVLKYI
jgi:hypothetical protein